MLLKEVITINNLNELRDMSLLEAANGLMSLLAKHHLNQEDQEIAIRCKKAIDYFNNRIVKIEESTGVKLCVKCKELVSWNLYFHAYICDNCNHRETKDKRYYFRQEGHGYQPNVTDEDFENHPPIGGSSVE